MVDSLADKIRRHVNGAFIQPARKAGRTSVSVTAGDIHNDLGFEKRMPAVCGALDAKKFQEQYRVVLKERGKPLQGATATWLFLIKT